MREIYRAYHAMAVAGVDPAHVRLAFEPGDLEVLQDMIMKDYWKHVRALLRTVPKFNDRLEFLAAYFERPAHEVLDAIATANFPQLTVAYTQPGFNLLRKWIVDLERECRDSLEA